MKFIAETQIYPSLFFSPSFLLYCILSGGYLSQEMKIIFAFFSPPATSKAAIYEKVQVAHEA